MSARGCASGACGSACRRSNWPKASACRSSRSRNTSAASTAWARRGCSRWRARSACRWTSSTPTATARCRGRARCWAGRRPGRSRSATLAETHARGQELLDAFARISDKQVRQRVLDLVKIARPGVARRRIKQVALRNSRLGDEKIAQRLARSPPDAARRRSRGRAGGGCRRQGLRGARRGRPAGRAAGTPDRPAAPSTAS